MRKSIPLPIFGLILFLFIWMNLPPFLSDTFRRKATSSFYGKKENKDELSSVKLENQLLKAQIDHVYENLLSDQKLRAELEFFQEEDFIESKKEHLKKMIHERLVSMPAKVIYRDPSSWSSSLWVNVGERDNIAIGKKVVALNSPVLADGALVGLVEHVAEKQSRIRLITDSGLTPSVRVVRGGEQNRELIRQLESFSKIIEKRDDLFTSPLEKESLKIELETLKKRCKANWENGYLAKGEIHGSSASLWRSRSILLKGIGFNYDYPDEEGFERGKKTNAPIIQTGDLLVTTGLDGVFPFGLRVGIVSKVYPLEQGSYAFDIEVQPSANNLNDLHTLFILPPTSE